MLGQAFLQKEFGYSPKIGWNLDMAGHSATNSLFYSEMGYEAQFFRKIDAGVLSELNKDKGEKLFFM